MGLATELAIRLIKLIKLGGGRLGTCPELRFVRAPVFKTHKP